LHIIVYYTFTRLDAAITVTAGRNIELAEEDCFYLGCLTSSANQYLTEQKVSVAIPTRTAGDT
jgi:hypothetical protein